ncbi:MAG: helix-turn-helix domain-containing protein [Candidatus Marinimicrobia bacterium]|nr:helix-turn-helix domain-containing protein [Candidatus Neomarinimicrobiota bacterium]
MFTATQDKLFYTIAELSNLLGLTEASLRSRIYRKQLPKVKLGGRILIPTTFIEKLIKQATEPENPF